MQPHHVSSETPALSETQLAALIEDELLAALEGRRGGTGALGGAAPLNAAGPTHLQRLHALHDRVHAAAAAVQALNAVFLLRNSIQRNA